LANWNHLTSGLANFASSYEGFSERDLAKVLALQVMVTERERERERDERIPL